MIVNWTPRNKLLWNFNWNSNIFIHENVFESVVCEMVVILSRGRWVSLFEVVRLLRVIIGPANSLVLIRQQAITWASDKNVLRNQMAAAAIS